MVFNSKQFCPSRSVTTYRRYRSDYKIKDYKSACNNYYNNKNIGRILRNKNAYLLNNKYYKNYCLAFFFLFR